MRCADGKRGGVKNEQSDGSVDPDPEIDASPALWPMVEQIAATCGVAQQLLQHFSC
jgi:hypothetical protein